MLWSGMINFLPYPFVTTAKQTRSCESINSNLRIFSNLNDIDIPLPQK